MNKRSAIPLLLAGLLLFFSGNVLGQTTCYVSLTGTEPASNAVSWATSTSDLQGAVNYVSTNGGGTVYVARGLYQPGGPANTSRTVSITLASGVQLMGGYEGTGTPGPRTAFPSSSTLSGILTGGNRSYHVVWMKDVSPGTTLDGFVVTGGQADGTPSPADQGGGIYTSGSSSPTLQNLVITGNTAKQGGAIYQTGSSQSLTVTNALILGNTATNNGGGLYAVGGSSRFSSLTVLENTAGSGGGFFTISSLSLTVTNTLLQSNTATSSGGAIFNVGGSSGLTSCSLISNSGGAIYNNNSHTIAMSSCLFLSNTASGNGGGLFNDGGISRLTGCSLTGNQAGSGGAIYNNNSSCTLTGCILQSNTVTNQGGGILNFGGSSSLASCTIVNNQSADGGAVYSSNHAATMNDCRIENNVATGRGGGIFFNDGSSNLTSCSLNSNQAVTGSGGSIYTGFNHSAVLSNCQLQNNTAPANGGAIYSVAGSSTLTSCTLTTNQSVTGNGGGICTFGNQKATLITCVFEHNTAALNGGSLHCSAGNSILTSCSFTSSSANSGGAISGINNQTLVISNSILQSNTATTEGGGIYSAAGNRLTAWNISFDRNLAGTQGGAVLINTGSALLINVSFRGNDAGAGTVIHSRSSSPQLINAVLFGNGVASKAISVTGGALQATYSLFEPATTGFTASPTNLTTVIPPFANPTGTELSVCTPAINAGSNAAFTGVASLSTDLAGNDRFYNTTIDMGAYEFQGTGMASVSLTNPTVNTALSGYPFSATFTASGGSSPYTFTLLNGSLPNGITLGEDGVLSGTPTTGGMFTAVVQATESGGCVTGTVYSLSVTLCQPVYTVTNTNEAGAGSLRQAMLDIAATTCPGPYTISVGITGTISLTSVLPNITKDITFLGPGAAGLTIQRSSGSFSIFNITANSLVRIEGVTIADGSATFGGGIFNTGRLTVSNCVIRNNQATSSGGGIYNTNRLIISGTLFTSNTATSLGGGLYNSGGSSTVTSCSFISNSQNAIANLNSHTALLNNCLLQSNTAIGNAGAIYNFGGSSTLISCSLISNSSTNGGAIFDAGNHTASLSSCVLQSNTASGSGGAIYNDGGMSTLTSCSFISNQGNNGGAVSNQNGHLAVISGCVLQSNSATTNGGGLYSVGGSSTLTSCSITNNQANNGGAVYMNNHTTGLINCVLQRNTAVTEGGSIYCMGGSSSLTNCILSENIAQSGGAIRNSLNHNTMLSSCLLQSNTATGNGGSIYSDSGGSSTFMSCTLTGNRGNVGGAINNATSHMSTLTDCWLQNNTATAEGGALLSNTGSSTLTDCMFSGNQANYGGAIYTISHSTRLSRCLLQRNTANVEGGGLFSNGGSSTVTSCSITGNQTQYGGGVSQSGNHTATLTDCVLLSNTATAISAGGGGLYASGGTSKLTSCSLISNQAGYGGAIYSTNHTAALRNCLLQSNTAVVAAGGHYCGSGSKADLVNVAFDSNVSSNAGAVFAGSGPYVMTNTSFRGNTADVGTTLFISSATVQLINGVMFGNGLAGNAISGGTLQATYTLFEQHTTGFTAHPSNLTTAVSPFANSAGTELAVCSPAIDAGENSATGLTGVTIDLANQPRFFDGGTGTATVDLGAYEFQAIGVPPVSFTVLGSGTATCTTSPTITLSGSETGVTYQLQRNELNTGTAVTGTGSAITFGPQSLSGTYTVIATRTGNSCTLTMTEAATVVSTSTVISASLVAGGAISCNTPSVTLTASPANLTYTFGSGATQTGLSNLATVNAGGTYSVTVSDAGGCSAVAGATVTGNTTAPTGATLTATAGGTLTCGQTALTLTASATGNSLSYGFSGPGVVSHNGSSALVNAPGNYTTVITAGNGCTISATTTVYSNTTSPDLSLSPSAVTLTCASPAAILSVTGTGDIRWSTGETSTSISVSVANTYSVTLTDQGGCSAVAVAVVSASPSLSGNAIVTANGVLGCGITTIMVRVQASGATSFTLLGPAGYIDTNNTGDFSVSAGGSYTGLAGQTGCVVSNTVTVIEGGVQPGISSVQIMGTLGIGACHISVQGTGFGDRYVLTGPSGYVFSVVFRTTDERTVVFPGIRTPGTYMLTVYKGKCLVRRTVTVTGSACP